jgi:hypothetical protein
MSKLMREVHCLRRKDGQIFVYCKSQISDIIN